MKKYIVGITCFFVMFFIIDRIAGFGTKYLVEHARSGTTYKNEYICDHTNEDILILGSSRAVHHYNPEIIKDSLGLSCYNCGYDGCGSITAYGLLRILSERYAPKMIIYEITPNFDYIASDKDNTKYLGPLKLYFDRPGIDTIFASISHNEVLKMQSILYQINTQPIQILSDFLFDRGNIKGGFVTRETVMSYEPDIDETRHDLELDSLKLGYLQSIISLCQQRDIRLVFMVSPSYKKTDDYEYLKACEIAKANNIPFINHYCDTLLNRNKNYFYDSGHMNYAGAEAYTKLIIKELRGVLN